jgi:uncharacterized membrane protein HdeD (DUF308 family)
MEIKEIRLFRNWWLLLLKGLIIIAFGVLALLKIFPSLSSLRVFIILTLINGILILFGTFFYRKNNSHWLFWLVEGAFDTFIGVAGIVFILMMKVVKIHVMNLFIIQIIALWALVHGIIHVSSAKRLKQYIPNGRIAFISGICVIILALVLFVKPLFTTAADYIYIGSFSIAIGLLLSSISIILRKIYSE